MALVFKSADGSQVIIGATGTVRHRATPVVPSINTFEFGVDTVAGNAPVDVGPAGTTISSGDASGHWQVNDVAGRAMLSPSVTGAGAQLSGSPYSLSLSSGLGITVTAIANAETIDSHAELANRIESGCAYGYTFFLREGGDYATTVEARPTSPPTGTFTPPSNRAIYHQGRDLDTGNYVRVRAHTGETPVITSRTEINPSNNSPGTFPIRFTGITWRVYDSGNTSQTIVGMCETHGAPNMAWDNCTFEARDHSAGMYERRVGIQLRNRSGESGGNSIIQDCMFRYVAQAISFISASTEDACIVGNVIDGSYGDGIKIGSSPRIRLCWNFIINKKHFDDGTHVDFVQSSGGGGADVTDLWVVGNVFARGEGSAGDVSGQGLFFDDLVDPYIWDAPVVVGNRILIDVQNGIFFGGDGRATNITDGAIIRNNTVLLDTAQTVGNGPKITIVNGGVNTNQDNVVCGWAVGADGGNFSVTTRISNPEYPATESNPWDFLTGEYDTYFEGGQAGLVGPAAGSTLAEVVASTDIKAGCALDTASPKIGAHQDYIDYANRTLNLPYSLPAPPA